MRMQGGAFPMAPIDSALDCAFSCYNIPAVHHEGYDVLANRPKQAAYRAPGSPMAAFATESLVDEMCRALKLDPLKTRLKNASREGTKASFGPTFPRIGLVETLEAALAHPHYAAPLGPNQGRGVASGYWMNWGGETSVSAALGEDGSVTVSVGTPDIGGSRASMALMAAEALGIPYENVRVNVVDTGSLGVNEPTHGSRATYATGLATIEAVKQISTKLCQRAADKWGIPAEAVIWEDGCAKPSGPNAGEFPPLAIGELAAEMGGTGGPISGHFEATPSGHGGSFGTHIVDVEVDPETGYTSVLRYTVVQDAGKAIHPAYVEGQFQGGAAQGIGQIGAFPAKSAVSLRCATKVTVGCCTFIDWFVQPKMFTDAARCQIHRLINCAFNSRWINVIRAMQICVNRQRPRHANRIRQLDRAFISDACGNDIFRQIARSIGRRAVNLGWVFT